MSDMGDIYISSHILGFLNFMYRFLFDHVRDFFFLSVFLHSIIHYTLMEFVGRNTDIYLLKHGMTLFSIKLLTKIDLRNVGTSLFLITRNPEVVALEIIHSTAQ